MSSVLLLQMFTAPATAQAPKRSALAAQSQDSLGVTLQGRVGSFGGPEHFFTRRLDVGPKGTARMRWNGASKAIRGCKAT
eukprot:6462693-Amphidinium_carterae.2